ncbi:4-oxalocrotonate tautomerase [Sphingosinicella microcystinivorans]|uniref:4-oxalocrotonate tautomerase n=1 Tax=Sphingosinicella microcystinivorans TaxID=335406 RepID=A0AAD1G296_SPHMI|nr:4-oxalocrotonate tautomerase family protein [Sphingosinicella microcystinivorans]BBE35500.1 4-oxalocrotonate tautomerase [Sphingosinicella microcystinivorans]
MPFVTVQTTREGTKDGVDHVTPEQKAAIHRGIADLLFEVLGKPPEWTWVVIQEVALEDWGWGGMPVLEYRRRLAERAGR